MSSLSERIDVEMKEAARAKEARRLNTLRMFKSALKYKEIELGKELGDAEAIAVCQGLIKQRRDAAAQYTAAARPELAEKENEEIALLEAFLPRQLPDDELAALVQEAVVASGAKGPRDMGAVMKAVQPKVAGRAEGRRVSDAVKKALAALSVTPA